MFTARWLVCAGAGTEGMVWKVDDDCVSVVWPSNTVHNYRHSEVQKIGRYPDIHVNDIVERGNE